MISELQKDKLQIILHDETLLETIEAVFEETIERVKPIINETNDNSILGEKYRAYEMAKELVRKGLMDLSSYKVDKEKEKPFNKSR